MGIPKTKKSLKNLQNLHYIVLAVPLSLSLLKFDCCFLLSWPLLYSEKLKVITNTQLKKKTPPQNTAGFSHLAAAL